MVGIATNRERTIHAGSLVQIDSQYYVKDARSPTRTLASTPSTSSTTCSRRPFRPATTRRPWVATATRARCPTAASSSRGPTARSTTSTSCRRRRPTSASTSTTRRRTRTKNQLVYNDKNAWDLYAIPLVARTAPPVIGSVQNQADSTLAGHARLARRQEHRPQRQQRQDRAALRAATDASMTLPDALRRRGQGPRHRRLLERSGARASRCSASRWTKAPPSSARRRSTPTAPGSPTSRRTSRCTSSRSTSSACRSATSASGSRACPAKAACAAAATRAAPATTRSASARTRPPRRPRAPRALRHHAGARMREGVPLEQRVQPLLNRQVRQLPQRHARTAAEPQTFYTLTKTDRSDRRRDRVPDPDLDFSETARSPSTTTARCTTWPTSYVSIFYPATLDMMPPGGMVTGTVPPKWGVPESARESVLIEKLNVQAADGTYAWDPATHPPHPEDVGVPTISRTQDRADAHQVDRPRRAVLLAPEQRLRAQPVDPTPGSSTRRHAMKTRTLTLRSLPQSRSPSVPSRAYRARPRRSTAPPPSRHGRRLPRASRPTRSSSSPPADRIKSVDASRPSSAPRRRPSGRRSSTARRSSASTASPSVEKLLYDANAKNREISAWWLRRRIFGVFGPGEVYERMVTQTLANARRSEPCAPTPPTRSASSSSGRASQPWRPRS